MILAKLLLNVAIALSYCSYVFVSSQTLLRHSNYGKGRPIGGFQEVNLDDPSMLAAAQFAVDLHMTDHDIDGILGVGPNNLQFSVVQAVQQVVAGINYQLTVEIMRKSQCVAIFSVMIYDRFGKYSITRWGDPMNC